MHVLLIFLISTALVGGLGCATLLALSSSEANTAKQHAASPLFTDRIFALARPDDALAKKIGNEHAIAFLGERNTYLVQEGGDRLIRIGEALDSDQLKSVEITSELFLRDKKAWGTLAFIYKPGPDIATAIPTKQLRELGFQYDSRGRYGATVNVKGTVLPPITLDESQLRQFTLRRELNFYPPQDAEPPGDLEFSAKMVGAMAVDVITAPLQMFGLAVIVLFSL